MFQPVHIWHAQVGHAVERAHRPRVGRFVYLLFFFSSITPLPGRTSPVDDSATVISGKAKENF